MRRERQLLGPSGTRGVASLISGMTLRERRALHEAVRQRILREAAPEPDPLGPLKDAITSLLNSSDQETKDKAGAVVELVKAGKFPDAYAKFKEITGYESLLAQFETPVLAMAASKGIKISAIIGIEESIKRLPIGAKVLDITGSPVFEKTETGWKALLRIDKGQILDLIDDPVARREVERQINMTKVGDELNIPKRILADEELANTKTDLTFKRTSTGFADPIGIDNKKMAEIVADAGLSFDEPEASATAEVSAAAAKPDVPAASAAATYKLGNVTVEVGAPDSEGKSQITIKVPTDPKYKNFDTLYDSTAEIGRRILKKTFRQERGAPFVPKLLKIPTKFAIERKLIRTIAPAGSFDLGFELSEDGDTYTYTDSVNSVKREKIIAVLQKEAVRVS